VQLDPKTQILYAGARFFINGESFGARHPGLVRELADRRAMDAPRLAPLAALVAEWHRAGYLHYAAKRRRNG
jgi:hypothetical protein